MVVVIRVGASGVGAGLNIKVFLDSHGLYFLFI